MSTAQIQIITPAANWSNVLKFRLSRLQELYEDAKKTGNAYLIEVIEADAYAVALPQIMQAGPRGRIVLPDMLDWYMDAHEQNAWYMIRNLALPFYPHFPVLGHCVSFADPFRRLAIELEPEAGWWAAQQTSTVSEYRDSNARQEETFKAHGWQLVRIPYEVATTDYDDILPPHLQDTEVNGYDSDEQFNERRNYDSELARRTMRGFFDWLRRHGAYSTEKLNEAIKAANLKTASAR